MESALSTLGSNALSQSRSSAVKCDRLRRITVSEAGAAMNSGAGSQARDNRWAELLLGQGVSWAIGAMEWAGGIFEGCC